MRENRTNSDRKIVNYKNPGEIVSRLGSVRGSGEVSLIREVWHPYQNPTMTKKLLRTQN
jgi:hypothetical protein